MEAKKAILLVHFGTTVNETREKTIDAIKSKFKDDFKDFEVREAFSSRMIIKILRSRGIDKDNPIEAMEKLAKEGYTHILVQMTNIINGIETENLKNEMKKFEDRFEEIKVGTPLLSDIKDYKSVARIIKEEIPAEKDRAVVMVGHGTHHHAGSVYPAMDYVFKTEGCDQYFVGTVEGYPEADDVKNLLKARGYSKVMLAPFMFVAGDHAINDIAGDWKEDLEESGFEVSLAIRGLGEYSKIQKLYIQNAKRALIDEMEDIAIKKTEISKK